MELDSSGRVVCLSEEEMSDADCKWGDAVCNSCELDMPICWDVVCVKCRRTFCYHCSRLAVDGCWHCESCFGEK